MNRTDSSLLNLSATYLSFLDDAFSPETGRFRNFMSYARVWLEDIGSEDSHGRALWALGVMAGRTHSSGQEAVARELFVNALPALETFGDSRPIAFPILGMQAYLQRHDDSKVWDLLQSLGDRLSARFVQYATKDWNWHEDQLNYDNARLPQALMACGRAIRNDGMVSLPSLPT